MEKKNHNEELQSRREFFKKVAKKTLPILGAVVLASNPLLGKAAEEAPMGCKYGCTTSCYSGCYNGCHYGCKTGCKHGCSRTCGMTCKGGNYGH